MRCAPPITRDCGHIGACPEKATYVRLHLLSAVALYHQVCRSVGATRSRPNESSRPIRAHAPPPIRPLRSLCAAALAIARAVRRSTARRCRATPPPPRASSTSAGPVPHTLRTTWAAAARPKHRVADAHSVPIAHTPAQRARAHTHTHTHAARVPRSSGGAPRVRRAVRHVGGGEAAQRDSIPLSDRCAPKPPAGNGCDAARPARLGTARSRRSAHGCAAQVAAVASMGFEPADAHAALLACGKDVGRAIEWYAHCRLQATAQRAADTDAPMP